MAMLHKLDLRFIQRRLEGRASRTFQFHTSGVINSVPRIVKQMCT